MRFGGTTGKTDQRLRSQKSHKAGRRSRKACQELGISERTLQRWENETTPLEDQRPIVDRPVPKNK